MAKKVVVTGGAGFVGSHLSGELAKQGYRVVLIDDLSTGKIENIESLLRARQADFVRGSVTDLKLLKDSFQGAHYVFHLAALASVPQSIVDPSAFHEINVTGTLNVLLAAKESSVKKVVCSSSSSVYGDTAKLPHTEAMVPHPLSPYAATKLAGECYCHAFHESYGLPTVSLRYFNIYGPGQDPDSPYAAVIPRFIMEVRRGKPPVIFGDGEQTRDFVFVKDAVRANILAAEGDAAGVFNVGKGESITLNRLAELIIGLAGANLKPVHAEPRQGDIRHSLADIAKAKGFGYKPCWSLEDGLRTTMAYFNEGSIRP